MRTMYAVTSSKRGNLGKYDDKKKAEDLAEFYGKDADYYGTVTVNETIVFSRG